MLWKPRGHRLQRGNTTGGLRSNSRPTEQRGVPASRCCTRAVPASSRSCTAVCLASSSPSQTAPRAAKPSRIESSSCCDSILSHNYTKDASRNYTKDAPALPYHSQCDRIVLCPRTDLCCGNHVDIGFNGTTQQEVCAATAGQLSNAVAPLSRLLLGNVLRHLL